MTATGSRQAGRVSMLVACALASLACPVLAQQPSFDCARAKTADELAICADAELAGLDATYAKAFAYVRKAVGAKQALAIARLALKERRACGAGAGCLKTVMSGAISSFEAMGAPVSAPPPIPAAGEALPEELNQCSHSFIATIEGRLSGDSSFESGTAVSFTNNGYQVSYEREQAIIDSRVGDPVEICLIRIPVNCPPGDDRGRWYGTTNLRTGGSWTLPDAQHECGGA